MEIFDYRESNYNKKPISNLNSGTVFEYEEDFYMKGTNAEGMPNHCRVINLDTGDIILTAKTEVGENETAGELFDRLAVMGADLLIETLTLLEKGEAPRIPQNEEEANYASMLTKAMCEIDFTKSAQTVHNLVRGLNPWPVAITTLEGKKVKIIETRLSKLSGENGKIVSLSPLTVACGEGAVEILTLQLEGKKAMDSKAFLMGHRLEKGQSFGT